MLCLTCSVESLPCRTCRAKNFTTTSLAYWRVLAVLQKFCCRACYLHEFFKYSYIINICFMFTIDTAKFEKFSLRNQNLSTVPWASICPSEGNLQSDVTLQQIFSNHCLPSNQPIRVSRCSAVAEANRGELSDPLFTIPRLSAVAHANRWIPIS